MRSNVLTVYNALLATLFVVILFTGRWQNGLFGLVIIAIAAIGIVQELRAKRTLDRLAVPTHRAGEQFATARQQLRWQ